MTAPAPPAVRPPSAPPPAADAVDPPRYDAEGPIGPMTAAEYLRTERAAGGFRCEYDGSRRVPMAGTSRRHSLLVKGTERVFDDLIAARPAADRAADPLETHRESVRVRVPAGRFRYPDVFACPDPPAMLDDEQDTVLNPLAIAEVLSPTTEHIDRGVKLAEYRAIPSLTDYLLIAQDEPRIDHYRRTGGGADEPDRPDRWELVTYAGPDAAVPLTGLGALSLGAVYGSG